MRIVLRLVALYIGLSVIAAMLQIRSIALRGGLQYLLHSGAFGFLTLAGWIVTLAVGPPAAFFLWKRERAGLILSFVNYAAVCLYDISVAVFWPNGRISFPMAGSGLLAIFLITPLARRACDQPNHRQLTTDN
jgi:glucose dehydrogenase